MRKHLVSPLDPWIEAFSTDPLTGLILIGTMALVMVGPEILTARLYLRGMLAKKLRKDIRGQLLEDVDDGLLDPAIKRATAGVEAAIQEVKELVKTEDVQARIAQVQARLEELDQALEARLEGIQVKPLEAKLEALDEALGQHFTAIHSGLESLPGRVRSSLDGSKGTEVKMIQKAAEGAEEAAVEFYEAELSPEERLAGRIDQMNPSPEWQQQHQVGNMIVQGVKEMVREQLLARRGNVVTMGRIAGPKGKFPSVYG